MAGELIGASPLELPSVAATQQAQTVSQEAYRVSLVEAQRVSKERVDFSKSFLREFQQSSIPPELNLQTIDEYRLEIGRNIEKFGVKGAINAGKDQEISLRLMASGHPADKVADALDRASPHGAFEPRGYGERTAGYIQNLAQQNERIGGVFRDATENRNAIDPQTTRLDRIGMATELDEIEVKSSTNSPSRAPTQSPSRGGSGFRGSGGGLTKIDSLKTMDNIVSDHDEILQ